MLNKKKSRKAGKKLSLTVSFMVLFTVISNLFSNPIASYFFNEFMIDSTGWKLEIHPSHLPQDSVSLNGWCLTSKTDTAYFNDDIYLKTDQYTVITPSEMQNQFLFNALGDSLVLYDENGEVSMDILFFGRGDSYAPSPAEGQSVCLGFYSDEWGQHSFYYLDSTPTFGFENDTLNANGSIDGFIKDSLNNPIAGVKVIYGYYSPAGGGSAPLYVVTNSDGYFIFHDLSILKNLEFEKEGYFATDTLIQMWPDSTITINIQMSSITGITELPAQSINTFELSQNYPNPFNNSTTFIYSLAEEGFVKINIYDEKGELIQTLFKGNQSKGQYKVNWNADNLASGIYFYELKTKNQKMSKKCLLLK